MTTDIVVTKPVREVSGEIIPARKRTDVANLAPHPPVHLDVATVDMNRPESAPYEVRDKTMRGLILRVQPSGTKSWVFQYGYGKRITIGRANVISPSKARKIVKKLAGMVAEGIDLQAEKKARINTERDRREKAKQEKQDAKLALTFSDYVTGKYATWLFSNKRKYGPDEVIRLRTQFKQLLQKPLAEITAGDIEKWKEARIVGGASDQTINRNLAAIKAAMSRAHTELALINHNPLKTVKLLKIDTNPKPRFLSPAEEKRLLKALHNRNQRIRAQTVAEGDTEYQDSKRYPYADRMMPMITVAMHTGIRRGESFSLRWKNVDLRQKRLEIEGMNSKGKVTRHVPLNSTALKALRLWKQTPTVSGNPDDFVFAADDGHSQLNTIRNDWEKLRDEAKLTNFRWHDLRHHFASRLVQNDVGLNVVRALLGHKDLTMTLRYAYLNDTALEKAVAQIAE